MLLKDVLIYNIKDEMDGTYSFIKHTGKKKNDYIRFYIQYCKVCGDEIVTYYRYRNSKSKTFGVCRKTINHPNGKLNAKISICKLKYIQSLEKPIEYNGKIYTIENVPDYIKSIYQNPIRRFVNKTKWEDEHKAPLKGRPIPRYKLLDISKEEYEKARYQAWIESNSPEYYNECAKRYREKYPLVIRIRNLCRTLARQAISQDIVTKSKDLVDCKAGAAHLRKQAKEIMKIKGYKNISTVFKHCHIAHIIPKSMYDFQNDPIEFANANHHLNLRLISKFENLSKGCRLRKKDLKVIKDIPTYLYPKSWKGIIPLHKDVGFINSYNINKETSSGKIR